MKPIGDILRERREELYQSDRSYSLRQVAKQIGVSAPFLSQVERNESRSLPSEETLIRWAEVLDLDPDVVLALAGKVSSDLQAVILKRPALFAQLLRELKDLPDHAVLRVVREVRDGEW